MFEEGKQRLNLVGPRGKAHLCLAQSKINSVHFDRLNIWYWCAANSCVHRVRITRTNLLILFWIHSCILSLLYPDNTIMCVVSTHTRNGTPLIFKEVGNLQEGWKQHSQGCRSPPEINGRTSSNLSHCSYENCFTSIHCLKKNMIFQNFSHLLSWVLLCVSATFSIVFTERVAILLNVITVILHHCLT